MLVKAAKNETLSLKEREKALNRLHEICPTYHGELSKEGKLINDNKETLDKYLASLKQRLLYEAEYEKLKELYKKKVEVEDEEAEANKEVWRRTAELYNTGKTNKIEYDKAKIRAKNLHSELGKLDSEIDRIEKKIGKLVENQGVSLNQPSEQDVDSDEIPTTATPESGGKETEKEKKVREELAKIDVIYNKKASETKKNFICGDL